MLFLQDYYRSGRMLVRMAEAIGRLVLAGRDLTRLSGFTARVNELIVVLRDLQKGVYERTMVTDTSTEDGMCLSGLCACVCMCVYSCVCLFLCLLYHKDYHQGKNLYVDALCL